MSQPTPNPEQTRASADPRELARREAAVARASRRLRMVTDLGDMAMTLARAVHERALAEEVAAKAALAVRDAVKGGPEEEPAASSEVIPSQSAPSQSARSGERTRRATPSARVRLGSCAAERAPVMDAGALFARLSDIVRHCLELEIRIDEDLRRLEAAAFLTLERDATLGRQIKDAGQEDSPQKAVHRNPALEAAARTRVRGMVEAVIDDEAKTWQKARSLYDALREHLDEDEAYRDLASRPDAVSAARLCRDLGLHPTPGRWRPPSPDCPVDAARRPVDTGQNG